MLFGVQVEVNKVSLAFFENTKKRLENPNWLKVPYLEKVLYNNDDGTYVFLLNPIWGNFWYLGLPAFILPPLLGAAWVWSSFGLLIMLTGFAHSSPYYFVWLWLGLRKAGYKGDVFYLSARRVLARALLEGWNLGTD